MLEDLMMESFTPLVGQTFEADTPAGLLPLTLAEAASLGAAPDAEVGGKPLRAPFSLVFAGPIRPILPQRIYAVHHAALGRVEIFLVPIGPSEGNMQYQAVFG